MNDHPPTIKEMQDRVLAVEAMRLTDANACTDALRAAAEANLALKAQMETMIELDEEERQTLIGMIDTEIHACNRAIGALQSDTGRFDHAISEWQTRKHLYSKIMDKLKGEKG